MLVRLVSRPELVNLSFEPGSTHPQFGPDAPDGPGLLDHAGVQVAGKVSEALRVGLHQPWL
jgi:hypothetical protein